MISDDTGDTLIIVPSNRVKEEHCRRVNSNVQTNTFGIRNAELNKRILTINEFSAMFQYQGHRYSKLVFDDYFNFDNDKLVLLKERVATLNEGEDIDIVAFGTLGKQIPAEIFNLVKEHKAIGGQVDDLYETDELDLDYNYWIKRLYYSFITDLDTTIVIGPGTLDFINSGTYLTDSLNLPFI